MAEQEACAQIVAEAADGVCTTTTTKDGDSKRQFSSGECPGGTALTTGAAAGSNPLSAPLLNEVHGALARLQGALCQEGRGEELLELVAKLQAGLLAEPQKRPKGRFSRRRDRKTRHTVGVTKEELDSARRLIEDMNFPKHVSEQNVRHEDQFNAMEPGEEPEFISPYTLQKQGSLGAFLSTFGEASPLSPVRNATAQPFVSPVHVDSQMNTNSIEDKLVFHGAAPVKQKNFPVIRQASIEASPLTNRFGNPRPTLEGSVSLDGGTDLAIKHMHNTLMEAARMKGLIPDSDSSCDESEDGDDVGAIDGHFVLPQRLQDPQPKPILNGHISPREDFTRGFLNKQPAFQNHQRPKFGGFAPNNGAVNGSPFKKEFPREMNGITNGINNDATLKPSNNRFTNKKIKMKRANTIDIPKPLHCYSVESDDEGDKVDSVPGPKPKIPQFEAKTENDRKFLAFINKHDTADNQSPVRPQNGFSGGRRDGGCNWSSCFGSIKNVFEGSTPNSRSSSSASAQKFWKASDDSVNFSRPSDFGPKFTKSGVQQLNNLRENKNLQSRQPWNSWSPDGPGNVIKGSLTIATPESPKMSNSIKPIQKPAPVNRFSHAPMSVFKPLPKKIVTSPTNSIPQIWSPPSVAGKMNKPFDYSETNKPIQKNNFASSVPMLNGFAGKPPTSKSPVAVGVPWARTEPTKDNNRVMNLASNRFEKKSPAEIPAHISSAPPPLFKEKNFNPVPAQNGQVPAAKRFSLPQSIPAPGALSAPNLVRKLENLKQQFENDSDKLSMLPEKTPLSVLPEKIDAEKLQIEFYEKQIRENSKKFPAATKGLAARRFSEQLPPPDYNTYTVTDYTPPAHVSTFSPFQQIPDIEENKPRPQKKLPDLVLNDVSRAKKTSKSPILPVEKLKPVDIPNYKNINVPNFTTDTKKAPKVSDSDKEYKAVTKVMKAPVSQQAVIKPQGKSPQETYEKRDTAAKSLKGVLQKFSSPKHDVISQIEKTKEASQKKKSPPKLNNYLENTQPASVPYVKPQKQMSAPAPTRTVPRRPEIDLSKIVVPTIKYIDATPTKNYNYNIMTQKIPEPARISNGNRSRTHQDKSFVSDSSEMNAKGDTIISSRLHFPSLNKTSFASPVNSSGSQTPSPTALSKSESWHQLIRQNAMKPPSPRISPGSKVSRAKSLHLLAVPKQYEAGISKDEVRDKKKTVEAYFSGQLSPNKLAKSSSQKSIHEEIFEQRTVRSTVPVKYRPKSGTIEPQPATNFSLGRSRTMPLMTFAELALLDENNVEDAFEDLFKSS